MLLRGKVTVRTTPESGFLLSAEQLRAALTPKTRLLVICNPSNPTGACVVPTPPTLGTAPLSHCHAGVSPHSGCFVGLIDEKHKLGMELSVSCVGFCGFPASHTTGFLS